MLTCDICKRKRKELELDATVKDISEEVNFPKGTLIMKIKFCIDSEDCRAKIPAFQFFTKETVIRRVRSIK